MAYTSVVCSPWLVLRFASQWLAGCDYSRGRVPVTGTVLFDGKPLESGTIRFGGRSRCRRRGPDRERQLYAHENASQKGVLPGKYDVLIASWVEERGSVRPDGSFSPGITRIPLSISTLPKSGLTAEVKKGKPIASHLR